MQDASGALSRAVRYSLNSRGTVLRVLLSRKWLDDPNRKFPVRIDPTVYTGSSNSCELVSGADADVSRCGDNQTPVWVGRDGDEIHRALVQFDLSDLLPGNALITQAQTAFWFDSQSDPSPTTLDLHELTKDFTDQATWNTYDGANAWDTPGGDINPDRETRRTLQPDWTGWWTQLGMERLAQGWIDGLGVPFRAGSTSPSSLAATCGGSRDRD